MLLLIESEGLALVTASAARADGGDDDAVDRTLLAVRLAGDLRVRFAGEATVRRCCMIAA